VETASRKVPCQHRIPIAPLYAQGMSTSIAEPGTAFRCIIMGFKSRELAQRGTGSSVIFSKNIEARLRLGME
jgi:hypothetical protein